MNTLKIALILDTMSIGGIPKAAIPFMDELSKHAEVTLILSNTAGALQTMIPPQVRVLCFPQQSKKDSLRNLSGKHRYIKATKFACKHMWHSRVTKRFVKSWMNICNSLPCLLDEKFDCAIAFHGMNICQLTRTLYQVNARKKVAWIHGDHPFEGKHKKDASQMFALFDGIWCVSKATKDKFDGDFPATANKTMVCYNVFNVDEIRRKASDETIALGGDHEVSIVTVGRVSPEKGQDLIPQTMAELLTKGYSAKWYIVGDGPDRARIEALVAEHGLQQQIQFVGAVLNPYPYMKACDIYVQPSYTEGYPLTIFEAAILAKPIVATNVGGTREGFGNNENIILTDIQPAALYEGIVRYLDDPELKRSTEASLQSADYSNRCEVDKFLEWVKQ